MPYENIKYIFQELKEESSKQKADRNIYKKYVEPEPTKKGGEVEKFDDRFRKENTKNNCPHYSKIMRMPNEVEILIKDDDEARFTYIKEHILDFCTFHEEKPADWSSDFRSRTLAPRIAHAKKACRAAARRGRRPAFFMARHCSFASTHKKIYAIRQYSPAPRLWRKRHLLRMCGQAP
jgi:hypothetical protein